MYISEQLKQANIAEYLLYMWQVEDTIRAYDLNIEKIAKEYIPSFKLNEEMSEKLKGWYENLIEMMHEESKEKEGHLQINHNIILLLNDLHLQILKSPKYPFYSAAYYKALPFIVEYRNKSNGQEKTEIENCFDALYMIMLLKAQGTQVTPETSAAISDIVKLLGMLSDYYKKDKANELEL
ncbi:MAG: DUF4924 family protein [Bacteroidaceae bacterium]|jgi:hypothetical protein|nr:DUF4924 family protein [Bacteroidaceae bacterium]